jgi:hypothetical protein
VSLLEDMEGAFLDAPCMAALGDSIGYKASGASSFAALHGYVDYRDQVRALEAGQAIEQDVMVQVLRSDVPVRPDATCRITLGRISGAVFRPANVRSDESGRYWEFDVVKTNG